MVKGALLFAVLAALAVVTLTCPLVPYHACVKVDKPKKCAAIEVCEKPTKELCGKSYCEYPYTCASIKKSVCKDFWKLKQKCESKKVCKEVKKPCGYGACKITHDCVKENVCYIKKVYSGRKLMGQTVATSAANAVAHNGGIANSAAGSLAVGKDSEANSVALAAADGEDSVANAASIAKAIAGGKASGVSKAIAIGTHGHDDDYHEKEEEKKVIVKGYKEVLVCAEQFTCVGKEPCKDVIIKKCVKDYLKPGIDVCHGGFAFYWYAAHAAEKCGKEYCGAGYKCAEVVVQKCTTPCGHDTCEYGEECVTVDDECKDFAYLETVCKDVYEPTCVPLSPYVKLNYKPPCKTIWKCEEEESVCGNKYCPKGYACAVEEKESCDPGYKVAAKVVEKPEVIVVKAKKVVPVVHVPAPKKHAHAPAPQKDEKNLAVAVSKSKATDSSTSTDTATLAVGHHAKAGAAAVAASEKSASASRSVSDGEAGTAQTNTNARSYGNSVGTAGAEAATVTGGR